MSNFCFIFRQVSKNFSNQRKTVQRTRIIENKFEPNPFQRPLFAYPKKEDNIRMSRPENSCCAKIQIVVRG